MQSVSDQWFNEAYYQRFYFDKKTRVANPDYVERLSCFVASYLKYLHLPIARVLDMGCGIGLWQPVLQRHFPKVDYHGVEHSEYLCNLYGWERGSVVDYHSQTPFDLVICQGVLPYLNPTDLKLALRNLGQLCCGALYLEAVTLEDYERDIIDETLTDSHLFRHRAALYRQELRHNFRCIGGGLWLSRQASIPTFELECADDTR